MLPTKYVAQKFNFDLGKVEKIGGKGENAVYQYFVLFLPSFFSAIPNNTKLNLLPDMPTLGSF